MDWKKTLVDGIVLGLLLLIMNAVGVGSTLWNFNLGNELRLIVWAIVGLVTLSYVGPMIHKLVKV